MNEKQVNSQIKNQTFEREEARVLALTELLNVFQDTLKQQNTAIDNLKVFLFQELAKVEPLESQCKPDAIMESARAQAIETETTVTNTFDGIQLEDENNTVELDNSTPESVEAPLVSVDKEIIEATDTLEDIPDDDGITPSNVDPFGAL